MVVADTYEGVTWGVDFDLMLFGPRKGLWNVNNTAFSYFQVLFLALVAFHILFLNKFSSNLKR